MFFCMKVPVLIHSTLYICNDIFLIFKIFFPSTFQKNTPPSWPFSDSFSDISAILDNSDVWLGPQNDVDLPGTSSSDSNGVNNGHISCTQSHDDWIRQLTSTLLMSGAIKDEMLRCMNPMCDFKV